MIPITDPLIVEELRTRRFLSSILKARLLANELKIKELESGCYG